MSSLAKRCAAWRTLKLADFLKVPKAGHGKSATIYIGSVSGHRGEIENMPRGPKGQKRPADVIGNAIRVAKIATGEVKEEGTAPPNSKSKGGKKGGVARAETLSARRRKEIAQRAAQARWRQR